MYWWVTAFLWVQLWVGGWRSLWESPLACRSPLWTPLESLLAIESGFPLGCGQTQSFQPGWRWKEGALLLGWPLGAQVSVGKGVTAGSRVYGSSGTSADPISLNM